VDVDTGVEGLEEPWITGEVCNAAEFDLVVVSNEERVADGRYERCSEDAALIGTHRNVVQVRVLRAQSSGPRHRLIERGMYPTVSGHFGEQTVTVGSSQLVEFTVTEQRLDELRPLIPQLLEGRGVGGVPRLGLAHTGRGETTLVVQQGAELGRRVQVQ
jgi:hypothetical protein